LRDEIQAMVTALAGAVGEVFGEEHVRAVWFKGSAQKEWQSPLDYVPALSDVDVHVRLSDEAAPSFRDLECALAVQESVERRFAEAMPEPLHMPRPQLNLVNELEQNENYLASPAAIVQTISGARHEPGDYGDVEQIRALDGAALIDNAREAQNIPNRAIDRPGKYLWDLLRALSWRVSPMGSRVLCVSGMDPEQAWSMNRTRILRALRQQDELADLANAWERYYLSAWGYYLAGHADGAAGREAIVSASTCLQLSGTYAQNALRI
jgi:hypothetical protein